MTKFSTPASTIEVPRGDTKCRTILPPSRCVGPGITSKKCRIPRVDLEERKRSYFSLVRSLFCGRGSPYMDRMALRSFRCTMVPRCLSYSMLLNVFSLGMASAMLSTKSGLVY